MSKPSLSLSVTFHSNLLGLLIFTSLLRLSERLFRFRCQCQGQDYCSRFLFTVWPVWYCDTHVVILYTDYILVILLILYLWHRHKSQSNLIFFRPFISKLVLKFAWLFHAIKIFWIEHVQKEGKVSPSKHFQLYNSL